MTRVRNAEFLLVIPIAALTGCSIAGDWKLVEVKPEGTEFPLSSVSFADDGTYTAKSSYEGKVVTSSGTYEWTGSKLTVKPKEGPTRNYSGNMRMDNKLVLKHESDKGETTGVMEKRKE
jgi:hypothetical protein